MLQHAWARYVRWLDSVAPELAEAFAPPASESEIRAYEAAEIGTSLPPELHELWLINGGQLDVGEPCPLFIVMELLSPTESLYEWRMWQDMWSGEDAENRALLSEFCTSFPEGAIQPSYVTPGWIPVFKEILEPDYLGVDLNPGPNGRLGQVINFGRIDDEKVVIAWTLSDLLEFVARDVESGAILVEPPPDGFVMPELRREAAVGRYISWIAARAEREGPLS